VGGLPRRRNRGPHRREHFRCSYLVKSSS
jgi:GTPase_YlqF: ribosome biogenesis GTP-binding protein YlqF